MSRTDLAILVLCVVTVLYLIGQVTASPYFPPR